MGCAGMRSNVLPARSVIDAERVRFLIRVRVWGGSVPVFGVLDQHGGMLHARRRVVG